MKTLWTSIRLALVGQQKSRTDIVHRRTEPEHQIALTPTIEAELLDRVAARLDVVDVAICSNPWQAVLNVEREFSRELGGTGFDMPHAENAPTEQEVFDELPAISRRCLWLRTQEKRTYDEIAQIVGIDRKRVMSALELAYAYCSQRGL